jgi:hypothetical protein
MSTEVQTFEQRVRDKLKKDIADLIPEEQLTQLVHQATVDFIKTDLPKMINHELAVMAKAKILEELDKPEWKTAWRVESQTQISQQVEKLIKENAHTIMATMIAGVASGMVNDMRNRLYQHGINTF